MSDLSNFFSGFFSVETIIGLISAIIAGVIFILYKNNTLAKIRKVSESIKNEVQVDVVKSLAEVINIDNAINELPKSEKAIIVKQILTDKQKRFLIQIRLTTFGISILALLIFALIYSQNRNDHEDNGNKKIEFVDLSFKDNIDSSLVSLDLKIVNNLNDAVILKRAEIVLKRSWKLKKLDRQPASYLEPTGLYTIEIPYIDNPDSIYKSSISLSQSISPKSTDRFFVRFFMNDQLGIYLGDLYVYYNNESKPLLINDILFSSTPKKYLPQNSNEEFSNSLKFNLTTMDEIIKYSYSLINPGLKQILQNARTYR